MQICGRGSCNPQGALLTGPRIFLGLFSSVPTFLSSRFLTTLLRLFFCLLHLCYSHVRGILCGMHTSCMGSLFPIVHAKLSLVFRFLNNSYLHKTALSPVIIKIVSQKNLIMALLQCPVTKEDNTGDSTTSLVWCSMAVCSGSRSVALLSTTGLLWLGTADLTTQYTTHDTRSSVRPKQLAW